MTTARALSDRLALLLRAERTAFGDFLVALAAFDRNRGWEELGYTSLFYYLHRELGLSKGTAYHRKVAAELIQRFPELVEALRDGTLCITSVVELSKVLTPENRAEVLPRFFHCSKREAQAVAVEIRPAEVIVRRDVVTAVAPAPAPREVAPTPTATLQLVQPVELPATEPERVASGGQATKAAPVEVRSGSPNAARDEVEPLTADLRRLHVTVTKRVLAKLEAARDGLSHAMPAATTEQVLEAALDALLAKQAARRGLVKRPRTPAGAGPTPAAADAANGANAAPDLGVAEGSPGHIPAHVRREVWKRDGGKCQWALESGGICGATRFLELDHVVPRARGGPTTIANLRILCHAHNQLAARQAYGEAFMERFTGGRRTWRA